MTNADISDDFKLDNTEKKFNHKEKIILEKNKKFFSFNRKYIDTMLEIINGDSDISIRLLDWFVSNYSKEYNTTYKIKLNDTIDSFCIYNEYQNQLGGYSKDYFDPFCRKKKISYLYKDRDNKNSIAFKSSIGQLNFFQWAIRNRIIPYVRKHIDEIESDMKTRTKESKQKKIENLSAEKIKTPTKGKKKDYFESDPVICSSESINNFYISPIKKSASKSDSENKGKKRQQLSKSVYDNGIIKNNKTICLEFDY